MFDDFDCGICPEEYEDLYLDKLDYEMHPEKYE